MKKSGDTLVIRCFDFTRRSNPSCFFGDTSMLLVISFAGEKKNFLVLPVWTGTSTRPPRVQEVLGFSCTHSYYLHQH